VHPSNGLAAHRSEALDEACAYRSSVASAPPRTTPWSQDGARTRSGYCGQRWMRRAQRRAPRMAAPRSRRSVRWLWLSRTKEKRTNTFLETVAPWLASPGAASEVPAMRTPHWAKPIRISSDGHHPLLRRHPAGVGADSAGSLTSHPRSAGARNKSFRPAAAHPLARSNGTTPGSRSLPDSSGIHEKRVESQRPPRREDSSQTLAFTKLVP
jgi:hypothetical protein